MQQMPEKMYDLFIKDNKIFANNNTIILNTNDIVKISIVTNDQGPFLEDAFIYIYMNNNEEYFTSIDNPYFNNLYDELSKLPDFDFNMIIKSMQCTDNNEFVCWQKKKY